MRRVMKWLMILVIVLCLLAGLAYVAYLKRDQLSVMLGLTEPKIELSKTPLFKPMERLIISLEGAAEPHYLVLELVLVTHVAADLTSFDELTPLIRNAMVQYFSNRSEDAVKTELQNIAALQASILAKLQTTLDGYGYKTHLDEILITKVLVQ